MKDTDHLTTAVKLDAKWHTSSAQTTTSHTLLTMLLAHLGDNDAPVGPCPLPLQNKKEKNRAEKARGRRPKASVSQHDLNMPQNLNVIDQHGIR